tara:strand:- start:4038 stop:4472 length:435 start_codon:yes stop_codon:yes gene_type:complete
VGKKSASRGGLNISQALIDGCSTPEDIESGPPAAAAHEKSRGSTQHAQGPIEPTTTNKLHDSVTKEADSNVLALTGYAANTDMVGGLDWLRKLKSADGPLRCAHEDNRRTIVVPEAELHPAILEVTRGPLWLPSNRSDTNRNKE